MRLQFDEKPPRPKQRLESKVFNDHFVFNNEKTTTEVFLREKGQVNRSETSLYNINSSKRQSENSKITHLEGDNDIIDLDSSQSVKSLDNPEVINGPAQSVSWIREHSPVSYMPASYESNAKAEHSDPKIIRQLQTPIPDFLKDPSFIKSHQDLVLVQSSAVKLSGFDSKFGVSQNSQSIDYEQLFRLREDYIFSCDSHRMYMLNLKRQQQTVVELQGGPLFAWKQQICRLQRLKNEITQFTLAAVDDLDFKPAGIVQMNLNETACC